MLLDGRDVTDVPPHRRGVGLVFQDAALFPHRDVAGNVGFGPRVAGLSDEPSARRACAEALELVGLAGSERRDVTTLSGGEAQRVALARALAPRPRCAPARRAARRARRAAAPPAPDTTSGRSSSSSALTVVHVTHDVGEAFALGDRVAVLRAGRLAQVAAPDELWARPADDWVARFLGMRNVVARRRPCDGDPARGGARRARATARSCVAAERDGAVVRLRVRRDDGTELEAVATGVDHPRPGDRVGVEIDPDGVSSTVPGAGSAR